LEKERKARLIAYSNDAFALASANFYFPIREWEIVSQITDSKSVFMKNETWQLKMRNIKEFISLNPDEIYTPIPERLKDIPRGYSLKIKFLKCLWEDIDEIYNLDFFRDTVHQSYFTEKHQDYVMKNIEKIWAKCSEYYKRFPEITLESFRPSILVLEAINENAELAGNFDFLKNIYRSLSVDSNPISKLMYEIVWRVEKKRGTWEYVPYD